MTFEEKMMLVISTWRLELLKVVFLYFKKLNKRERGMKMTLKTFNNSQFKKEKKRHFLSK
jgi:hypothetical protein